MSNHPLSSIRLIVFFIACLVFSKAVSQTNAIPVINQQKQHQVKSNITKTTYELYVSLPKNYSASDTTKYPVLYLLDGNYTFPIVHATRQLLDFAESLEGVIIVGIGYPLTTSWDPWFVNRWRDFTPTPDPTSDSSLSFLGMLNLRKGSLTSGGAKQFVTVLKSEIIPFIEKNYHTNNDKGIAGHSFGGLFATYCFVQEPTWFNRYGMLSPSLWWDKDIMLVSDKPLVQAHWSQQVFISVGNKEGDMMTSKMAILTDHLKSNSYPGLTVTSQVFDDEGHFSVVPASISRMLRALYRPKKK